MTNRTSHAEWAANPGHWLNRRAAAGDTYAAAARVILAQPWCAPRVAPWIGDGPDDGSIWFADILAGGWSTGEHTMLELAAHLWNSGDFPAPDLDYLLTSVDTDWLSVALAAMAARHGRPLPAAQGDQP